MKEQITTEHLGGKKDIKIKAGNSTNLLSDLKFHESNKLELLKDIDYLKDLIEKSSDPAVSFEFLRDKLAGFFWYQPK